MRVCVCVCVYRRGEVDTFLEAGNLQCSPTDDMCILSLKASLLQGSKTFGTFELKMYIPKIDPMCLILDTLIEVTSTIYSYTCIIINTSKYTYNVHVHVYQISDRYPSLVMPIQFPC